jgi:DNA-binding SARP family transcriptional activator
MTAPKIQVLGPIQVDTECGLVRISGDRLKAFLGALTISVNHAVRTDTLVQVVWNDTPPASLDTSVHSLATKLRELIGHDAVVMEDHSYRLLASWDQIDACVFERLAEEAEDLLAEDPERSLQAARRGLELWRGPAYGDLGDVDPFRLESIRLEQLRCSTTETLIMAELALGRATRAIPMLMSMLEETPYRERMWAQLITALGREERRGEALQAFEQYQTVMRDLGLEPARDVVEALERALRP